jgi:hypothetical protein
MVPVPPGTLSNSNLLHRVKLPRGAIDLACADYSTVAILESSSKVYEWGLWDQEVIASIKQAKVSSAVGFSDKVLVPPLHGVQRVSVLCLPGSPQFPHTHSTTPE